MKRPTRGDLRQFAAFVAVGLISAAIDGGTFLLLHRLGLVDWAANVIGYSLAFLVNYHGNRALVFKVTGLSGALRRYVILVLFNLGVSTLLVRLGLVAGLPPWLAKAGSIAVVATVNFVLLRLWVFRVRHPQAKPE